MTRLSGGDDPSTCTVTRDGPAAAAPKPRVAFGAGQRSLEVGEGIDEGGCLKRLVSPSGCRLLDHVRLHESRGIASLTACSLRADQRRGALRRDHGRAGQRVDEAPGGRVGPDASEPPAPPRLHRSQDERSSRRGAGTAARRSRTPGVDEACRATAREGSEVCAGGHAARRGRQRPARPRRARRCTRRRGRRRRVVALDRAWRRRGPPWRGAARASRLRSGQRSD